MFLNQASLNYFLLLEENGFPEEALNLVIHQPAVEFIKRSEHEEAIKSLNNLIAEKKANFYTYYLRGLTYWLFQRKAASIRDFKVSLKLFPIISNRRYFVEVFFKRIHLITSPALFSVPYQKTIRQIVKSRMRYVKNFHLSNASVKKMRKHELNIASLNWMVILQKTFNLKDSQYVLVSIGCLTSLFLFYLPMICFSILFKVSFSLSQWFLALIFVFISAYLPFLPMFLFDISGDRESKQKIYLNQRLLAISAKDRFSRNVKVFIFLMWLAGSAVLYLKFLDSIFNSNVQLDLLSFSVLSGVPAIFCYILIYLFTIYSFIILSTPIYLTIKSYIANHLTDSFIVSKLVDILILQESKNWSQIGTRNSIIKTLQVISLSFRSRMPRLLTLKDRNIKEKYIKIGCYVQDLTTWVALPKGDTKEYLSREIANFLEMFLQGDLDGLAHLEPRTAKRSNSMFLI